jgi:hypothetical protein
LHTQGHKEALVDLGVELWVSISCVGLISRVKHSRARKYQHKQDFSFKEVSLAKLKVVWTGGGIFHEQNIQHPFFATRVEQLKHFIDSQTREA